MSFQTQTARNKEGPWETSNLVFPTSEEAMAYAEKCADFSAHIADYRVIPSDRQPTHRFANNKTIAIPWSLETVG